MSQCTGRYNTMNMLFVFSPKTMDVDVWSRTHFVTNDRNDTAKLDGVIFIELV